MKYLMGMKDELVPDSDDTTYLVDPETGEPGTQEALRFLWNRPASNEANVTAFKVVTSWLLTNVDSLPGVDTNTLRDVQGTDEAVYLVTAQAVLANPAGSLLEVIQR